jgi:plastocyanin
MKKTIVFSAVLTGALILGGCSLYGGTSSSTPSNNSKAPAPAQGSSLVSNAVNIQNFAFSPATLTVKKGTAVTWTNSDSAPHQIKSDTFNSGQLSKGQSFSFTFNDTGTFDYSCSIHPSMTGKIIVE